MKLLARIFALEYLFTDAMSKVYAASRKPPMLVIVALANKTARIVWALMAKGGTDRAPATPG